MLVVNASNADKDHKWITEHAKDVLSADKAAGASIKEDSEDTHEEELVVRNVSDNTAMIALQGPKAEEILGKVVDVDLSGLKRFRFADAVVIADVKALVSRTGYTGEDGFEIYVSSAGCVEVWDALVEAGAADLTPVGLAARDTLRLEAALMLYGNDLNEQTTPLEAAIEWTVKLEKDEFIGKDELLRQKASGVEKKMVGFELLERGVARHGYKITVDGDEIGYVTSGSYAPSLKKSIGLGYVKAEHAEKGAEFEVVVRDKQVKAKVVELPFIKR